MRYGERGTAVSRGNNLIQGCLNMDGESYAYVSNLPTFYVDFQMLYLASQQNVHV